MSVGTVVYVGSGETGRQRLAELFEPSPIEMARFDGPAEIGRLSEEITRLRSETRMLALEKEALNIKIAALESDYGPITGSIPDAADVEAQTGVDDPEPRSVDIDLADTGEIKPKAVRTIDVGFSPLPLESGGEETVLAEEAINSELAELADPTARRLPTEVSRTRFALQLGVGDTMDAVRSRWITLSREQDILLGPLEPAIAISEEGEKIRIRLLAGPFINAADAIQVCMLLMERGVECQAVRSEGQKLVMR